MIKRLSSTGTRKIRIDLVCYVLTVGLLLTMLLSGMHWVTADWVKTFGVTFSRWWTGVGLMVGGYVVSENVKKQSEAYLNKDTTSSS